MAVQDGQVYELIKEIATHFNDNISTRFLRQRLSHLPLESKNFSIINSVADHPEDYCYRGMMLQELYDIIQAYALFIQACESELIPNLRELFREGESALLRQRSGNPGDKIVLEMAISNFPHNLQVLKDFLGKLYRRVVELDIDSHRVKPPVITRRPEVRALGEALTQRVSSE